MKAYTDFEQSQSLAKILPLESADMSWASIYDEDHMMSDHRVSLLPFMLFSGAGVPCWSLSALLAIIPKRIKDYAILRMDMGEKDFSLWYDDINLGMVNLYLPDVTKENPIDTCVEMVVKLHEQKLL